MPAEAPDKRQKDPVSGVETTGHEWDGLQELNHPAPRWWLWVFLVTIIWAVGYWVVYPAWPVPGGNTHGRLQWTEYGQLKNAQGEITARRAKYLERFKGMTIEQINADPELYEFALAGGATAFKDNCTACHGTGAEGRVKGFPNLNDDDWLWGGSLEDIYKTIRVGVNSGHPDARGTQMPAFGRDGILTREQVSDVADYVLTLHKGDKAETTAATERGHAIFTANCTACHNEGGVGNQSLGAPRLNDEIWLYGGAKADVVNTVTNAHAGVMPTWEHRLDDDTIKELAIYVHSLGGGK